MPTIASERSTSSIAWLDPSSMAAACERARREKKPILIDFHAPSCSGCVDLEARIYGDGEVARSIQERVIPLRVVTDEPDRTSTEIICNHIFIWSPSIQMISPERTLYHEFNGAPRHTRLSVGFRTLHHDWEGQLTPVALLAQLTLGLGKAAMKEDRNEEALTFFNEVTERYTDDPTATAEARYWAILARARLEDSRSAAGMGGQVFLDSKGVADVSPLVPAVQAFASALCKVPDRRLWSDWPGAPGKGDWVEYTDNYREVALCVYQSMCQLANEIRALRAKGDNPITPVQTVLGQNQLAYRDLHGLMLGVRDDQLDLTPFEGERRSIRAHLTHVMMAEWWAYRPQILHALELGRSGKEPTTLPGREIVERDGEPVTTFGTPMDLLTRYEVLHNKFLKNLSGLSASEMEIPSKWWEPAPVTVRFRLYRLGWHVRDHIVEIEKILDGIKHRRTETHRFARFVFGGLGEVESALIGAETMQLDRQRELASEIIGRAAEIEAFAARMEPPGGGLG